MQPKRRVHECLQLETRISVLEKSPAGYSHARTATWNRRLDYPSFSFRHGTSLKWPKVP